MEIKLKYIVKNIAPANNQIRTNGTSYPKPTGIVTKITSMMLFVIGSIYASIFSSIDTSCANENSGANIPINMNDSFFSNDILVICIFNFIN